MADDLTRDKQDQIPTNLRLLVLLEEVAKAGVPVTPSALKDRLNLPKPTLHRLFHTAEEAGYLQRDIDGRSYGPGHRLRRLAVNTVSSQRVRMVRLSILSKVAAEIGETCNIATPDRDGMTYLDRVETHWPLRIQLPIGTQVPFHCTASGKMYLASLRPSIAERYVNNTNLSGYGPAAIIDKDALMQEVDRTRKRGYATDKEEFMDGMTAVAVPIYDMQNRLVSTLSVHAPLQRVELDELVARVDILFAAAAELSELINS